MTRGIVDFLDNIREIKRGKVMVNRELLRALEYVNSSSKGNVVYISYRRIVNIMQGHRRLSNGDKSIIKSVLSSMIVDVNARRISRDKCVYVVSREDLALMIMRLKETLNE
ncbi:MAG: hypothetical protein ACP5L1_05825 [Caldivirga sp.]|uniref:hypothetical protein n=1 Tax=Caldivirga sp. TaxID=2080243 RepID=UPI003D0F5096